MMTIEEIRKGAPDGAQLFDGKDYFKNNYGVPRMYNFNTGKWDRVPHHYMSLAKPL